MENQQEINEQPSNEDNEQPSNEDNEQPKDEEQLLEIKKQKLKNLFNNKEGLILLSILIFAIIIRFYYFLATNGQPLWWDEAEYMSAAKSYAGILDYNLGGNRLPGFPLFMAIFFILGLDSETILRFAGLLIPSLILIFLTYISIKEMYSDKRIAVIGTLFITVLWEHLFYSNRFQTENFALIFQFLAIIILFKVHMKKQKWKFITPKYSLFWILGLSALAVFFRSGNFIFIPPMLLFIGIINKSTIFKKKFIPIWIIIIIIAIIPLFLTNFYQEKLDSYYNAEETLSWNSLTVFQGFFPSSISWIPQIIYWFFLLGVSIAILDFFVRWNLLKSIKNSSNNLDFKSDLFNLLTISAVMVFFIFFLRPVNGFEWRWFFPLLLGMLAFTGKGIITFSDFMGKITKNKKIPLILIILIVIIGVHSQLQTVDPLIKSKVPSYVQVKFAGEWLNQNSNPQDLIITASVPQTTYYSERKIQDFNFENPEGSEEVFLERVYKERPAYYIINIFEPAFTPEWAYTFPQAHPELLTPIQGYSLDQQGQQPALSIYKFNYDNP